jgi:hypothetical protein
MQVIFIFNNLGCGTGNYLVKIAPHVKEIIGLE